MKTITKHTVLKQGDKVYQPVEVDGNIIFIDDEVVCETGELYLTSIRRRVIPKSEGVIQAGDKIVAQSLPILESIPVISLYSYVKQLAIKNYGKKYELLQGQLMFFRFGFKSNPNKWTDEDIQKAIHLSRIERRSTESILKQISSINEIEVDEQWNIINFK
jgi:hypothetical protein